MGMRRIVARGILVLLLSGAVGVAGCGGRKDGGEAKPPAPTYTAEQAAAVRAQADSGDAGAQLKVGRMHATGDGAPQDTTEAVLWYRKAADQGLADAQFALAEAYATGTGVEGDTPQAAGWYRKAAAKGHVEAMKRLGKIYEQNHDFAAAGAYFEKAAEKGDPHAQYHLGDMYDLGFEVDVSDLVDIGFGKKRTSFPQDKSRAAHWFRAAAEQGWCDKADQLARYYLQGEGVKKDPIEGYKWALVAITAPNPDYYDEKLVDMTKGVHETLVADAKNVLTAGQEAEGEKRAREQMARVKCVVTTAGDL